MLFRSLPAREAIPSLLDGLKDKDNEIRTSASRAIRQIDPDVAGKLGL